MDNNTIYVLAVALVTWGGVFAYLMRLHFLARSLEEKLNRHNSEEKKRGT
jgi:hypothetical protein